MTHAWFLLFLWPNQSDSNQGNVSILGEKKTNQAPLLRAPV